ncbi:MAG: NUDIX hydrolase [Acidimicrobiales bacterium]
MQSWVVAAGLIEGPDGLVLVQNRRRNGSLDWSPPGGVIEVHAGESVTEGLTREVLEETGLLVAEWDGPVYDVEVVASELGWRLRAEVFLATTWSGSLHVDDPDGIVVDARWVRPDLWADHLAGSHRWVREPIEEWLAGTGVRTAWRYRVDGVEVVRLDDG